MSPDSILIAEGLNKSLTTSRGARVDITRDLSLSVRRGELVAVVGPSGAGKTTALRMLSGLLPPDSGSLLYSGEPIKKVPRTMSVVFQEYNKSLFPWLTVEENVHLPVRKLPAAERSARVEEALADVDLTSFAASYPWELSGGMQQRVAIARGMASRPELLLMDEPFASVDALTRMQLEDMVLRLWAEHDLSVMIVTHDIGEAVYMADRVLVLSARPSHVAREIPIDLPHPRHQVTTREDPRFQAAYREIFDLVTNPAGPAER